MPYVNGYLPATAVSGDDLIPLLQGATNVPGTGTTRSGTLAQILGGVPGFQFLPLIGGTVTGLTTFSGAGTGLAVTNNQTIGGTLGVVGAVSGAGFVARFATPGPIGNVVASTGAFTTLGASAGGALVGTFTGTPSFSGQVLFTKASGAGLTVTANAFVNGIVVTPNLGANSGTNLIVSPGGNGHTITFGDPTYGVGSMGTMTMGATASAASMIWNGTLRSQFYTTPGGTYTLAGTNVSIFNISANFTGVFPGFAAPYSFTAQDSLVGSVSSFNNALNVAPGAQGARVAMTNNLSFIQGPITGDTSSQQYVVLNNFFQASFNVGGTAGPNNGRGSAYGSNPQVILNSGATFWALANAGGEVNLQVQAGASVQDEVMQSFILEDRHAVAGSRVNYGLWIGAQVTALNSIEHAFVVGGLGGPFPLSSTGSLLDTVAQISRGNGARNGVLAPQLLTYGVNVSNVNFSQQSGYSFFAPGAFVDGTGQALATQGMALGRSGASYTIDVPKTFAVNSIAVNAAGTPVVLANSSQNNYYPGDIVYGTGVPPGQYKITHTQVLSAAVTAGGSGGTNGVQTVTGTTGTGTNFQASVTVAGGTITAVGSITVAGDYTVNPTNLNAEPVTGASLTGATLAIGVGVLTVTVLVPDVFATNITAITPIGGSGLGLTLTGTNQVRAGLSVMPTSGGLIGFYGAPPVAKQTGVAVTISAVHAALTSLGLIAP